jgi:hypothetical protein
VEFGSFAIALWAVRVPVVVLFAFAVFACVKSLFVVVLGYTQSLLERFATHFLLLPLIYQFRIA